LRKENKNFGNNENYYLLNKKTIMREFNSLIQTAKEVFSPHYGQSTVDNIAQQAQIELENLLSRLPYVIAFYKASKSLNLSKREMGKIIYEIAETYAQSLSSIKKWLYRKALFSKKMKNYWRRWLLESQTQQYPENWIGVYVESDYKTYEYGINFMECGWLKLVKEEGAEEVAPYACLCDYARMRAIGVGFKRTKTIAAGADICDFRFIKGGHTPRGWPPEDLEENKD
jgi:hypothetical protein